MEVINEVESDECDDDNHGYYKKCWVNKYVRGRRIQFVNTKRRREMRGDHLLRGREWHGQTWPVVVYSRSEDDCGMSE